jgi:hypothetical protein
MFYDTAFNAVFPSHRHDPRLQPSVRPEMSPICAPDDAAPPSPSSATSINTLPPELLIEIFAFYSVIEPLGPLAVRSVSPRWRDIADTSPLVWRHISLDDGKRSLSVQRRQAEVWAERSSPLTFDIEVNATNPDSVLPLISPLLPSLVRWRSFSLTGQREEEVDVAEMSLSPVTLSTLNVSICDWEIEPWEDDDAKTMFVPTYPAWPFGYVMNVWTCKLPSHQMLAPLRFTCISITEGSFGTVSAPPKSILEFLQACPELESFYFAGWPHDEDVSKDVSPVVSLPKLHTLHLRSTCSARAYLSNLDTPHLQNLYLAHLNVDFKLPGEYNEPGDSDDEAGDFSQSPWSDRATGMGLRKLIHRCKPPIKVLEMDFTDMRTKDFRYVFDKLPDLEDFRIVASDMSDTVVRMFKPTLLEDGSVGLRVPHLRQLKLYNCQRITGSAVVSALESRVAYTDKNHGDTLTEVVIVGCEGFTGSHRAKLERTLRNRLHID